MKKRRVALFILLIGICLCFFGGCENKDISISIRDARGNFLLGEEFSLGDIVVTKITKSGKEKIVLTPDEYLVDFSEFNSSKEGTYNITITLKNSDISYTYKVNVKNLITVVNVSYTGGAIYTTNKIDDIILTLDEDSTPGNVRLDSGQKLIAGTNDYTWTFTPSTVGFKAVKGVISLTVLVQDAVFEGLVIKTPPNKLTYLAFEDFDSEGLTVCAKFSDGSESEINDFTILNGNRLNVSVQTIVLEYNGFQTSIPILVNKIDAKYMGMPLDIYNAIYGQFLSEITLPEGFSWQNSAEIVGNAGQVIKKAEYAPIAERENYIAEIFDITINIEKANPDYIIPQNLQAEYGTLLENVVFDDSNFSWKQPQTILEYDIGNRYFKAKYIPQDTLNYNVIDNLEVPLSIIKSNRSYDALPSGLTIEYDKALNTINHLLYAGFTWVDSDFVVKDIGEREFLARFTYNADTTHYNTITNVWISVTVLKASPASLFSAPAPFMNIECGSLLNSLVFSDNHFQWQNGLDTVGSVLPNDMPNIRNAIYTPDDLEYYTTAIVEVEIYVIPIDSEITVKVISEGDIFDYFDLYAEHLRQEIALIINTNAHLDNIGEIAYNTGQILTVGTTDYSWTFTPHTSNYKPCQGTITLTVKDNKPQVLEISRKPNKQSYYAFDIFEVEGMEIRAAFTDGSTKVISNNEITITYESGKEYMEASNNRVIIFYQDLSVECGITVQKINPVEGTHFVLPELEATYGDTLADIDLAEYSQNIRWKEDPSTLAGNAGNASIEAFYIHSDTVNYNEIEISLSIFIQVATPTFIPPLNLKAQYGDLFSSIILPQYHNGILSWNNPNNIFTSLGNAVCQATFTPYDIDNYHIIENIELTVLVEKKDTIAKITYNGGTIYDSDNIFDIVLTIQSSSVSGSVFWMPDQNLIIGEREYIWKFVPTDTEFYNECTGTIILTVVENTLESVTFQGKSQTNDYVARTLFDTNGITVFANYLNGDTIILSQEQYILNYQENDGMLHGGDTYIIFAYQTKSVQYLLENPVALIDSVISIDYENEIYLNNTITNYINDFITLTIIESNNEGSIAFKNNYVLEIGVKTYNWIFIPDNAKDYKQISEYITISVYIDIDMQSLSVYTYNESKEQMNAAKNGEIYLFEYIPGESLTDIYALDSLGNIYYVLPANDSLIKLNENITFIADLVYSNAMIMGNITISTSIACSNLDKLTIAGKSVSAGEFISHALHIFDKTEYAENKEFIIYDGANPIDKNYVLSISENNNLALNVKENINGRTVYLSENFIVIYESLPLSKITLGIEYEIYQENMVIDYYGENGPIINFSIDTAQYDIYYIDNTDTYASFVSGSALTMNKYFIYVFDKLENIVQSLTINIYPYTYIKSISASYYDVLSSNVFNRKAQTFLKYRNVYNISIYTYEFFEDFIILLDDNYTYKLVLNGATYDNSNLMIGINNISLEIYNEFENLIEIAEIILFIEKNVLYKGDDSAFLEYSLSANQYVGKFPTSAVSAIVLASSGYEFQIRDGSEYQKMVEFNISSGENIIEGRLVCEYLGKIYYYGITLNLIADAGINNYINSIESSINEVEIMFDAVLNNYYIEAPINYTISYIINCITAIPFESYEIDITNFEDTLIITVTDKSTSNEISSFTVHILRLGKMDNNVNLEIIDENGNNYQNLSDDVGNPTQINGLNLLSLLYFKTDNPYALITVSVPQIINAGNKYYMFSEIGSYTAEIEVKATDNTVAVYFVIFGVNSGSPQATFDIGGSSVNFIANPALQTVDESSGIRASENWEYLYSTIPLSALGSAEAGEDIQLGFTLNLYGIRMKEYGTIYRESGNINVTVKQSGTGMYYVSFILEFNIHMKIELFIVFNETPLSQEGIEANIFN